MHTQARTCSDLPSQALDAWLAWLDRNTSQLLSLPSPHAGSTEPRSSGSVRSLCGGQQRTAPLGLRLGLVQRALPTWGAAAHRPRWLHCKTEPHLHIYLSKHARVCRARGGMRASCCGRGREGVPQAGWPLSEPWPLSTVRSRRPSPPAAGRQALCIEQHSPPTGGQAPCAASSTPLLQQEGRHHAQRAALPFCSRKAGTMHSEQHSPSAAGGQALGSSDALLLLPCSPSLKGGLRCAASPHSRGPTWGRRLHLAQ